MAGRIAYYGNIVRDGLVLLLDAAKKDSYPGSGTLWRDISGNGNNGTLTNGPTFNSNNGGSIVFDGIDDTTNCGLISSLPSGISPRTIQVWINYSSGFNPSVLASISGYGTDQLGRIFQLSVGGPGFNNEKLVIWGNNNNYISSFTLDRETWTNVTVTVTSGVTFPRITIYKNGVSDGGAETNINTLNTESYVVGGRLGTYSRFKGRIAQNLVYNRALTPAEVLQNFNATRGRYGI